MQMIKILFSNWKYDLYTVEIILQFLFGEKKSNPRKMAKLQVQVKHFVAYTGVASQLTNFE